MLFKNALIENSKTTSDFRVENGLFQEFGNLTPKQGEEVTDLQRRLVLPPFVESHVHLDTCLTAGDPVWNKSAGEMGRFGDDLRNLFKSSCPARKSNKSISQFD